MSTLQERLSVLESTVMGNGNKGHKDRLRDLEDKEANMSCQTGVYIKRYIERMEKKRTYRIGDIANVLNAVGLIVVLAKLFFWGA